MPLKTYREAINEALLQEMKKDENVVVIGEDVAGGAGTNGEQDAWGGVLGVTKGLLKHFGRERIIDTPITETAIMGMASGAALTGLRPVAELMFVDFMGVCFGVLLGVVLMIPFVALLMVLLAEYSAEGFSRWFAVATVA